MQVQEHVGMLLTALQSTENEVHVGIDAVIKSSAINPHSNPYISEPDSNPLHHQ